MAFHFIGDRDSALGFQFAGVTCSPVATEAEADQALDAALERKDLKVLIVTELVASQLDKKITAHRLSAQPPFIVEVSDVWGTEVERMNMQQMIQEAVGIRISGKES
jgi:vacuolar-type H+-ATPase subunit F/Vma7